MSEQFELIVTSLLQKHRNPHLLRRWEEANSFGAGTSAASFFIRDAPDAVNIVWLNEDGIRDVAYIPHRAREQALEDEGQEQQPNTTESMFNYLPVQNVVSMEMRERIGIARTMGPGIMGNLMVQVFIASSPGGQMFWVAHTPEEEQQLRQFFGSVLEALVSEKH